MTAVVAGCEHERDVGCSEEALPGHERGGERPGLIGAEALQLDERVRAGVVLVDARLDTGHVADDRVDLERVQAAAGRTRALDADDICRVQGVSVASEHVPKHGVQLFERHRRVGIEGARRAPGHEGVVELALMRRSGERQLGTGADVRELRRWRTVVFQQRARRGSRVGAQQRDILLARRALHAAPLRHVVVGGRVDVPLVDQQVLIALAKRRKPAVCRVGEHQSLRGQRLQRLRIQPPVFDPLGCGHP